jgi:hypothetical protein
VNNRVGDIDKLIVVLQSYTSRLNRRGTGRENEGYQLKALILAGGKERG